MVAPAEQLLTQVTTLQTENSALRGENQRLALRVKDLTQQLWGKKAERFMAPPGPSLFGELAPEAPSPAGLPTASRAGPATSRRPGGPKPLDPTLPREAIPVTDPDPAELWDPHTGRPFLRLWQEELEVLARRAPQYYVKRYVRTVWGKPDRTALAYTPWPTDVWPRAHVHTSVVADIAVQHYDAHQPYYRLERQYAQVGVTLPRSTHVALMAQLDTLLMPLVERMRRQVLARGYLQLDATPIPVQDPARPGRTVEGTLWAYHGIGPPATGDTPQGDAVWFDYQSTKSPKAPDQVLRDAHYQGLLQTDAAQGLGTIGLPTGITRLGCFAHVRRYFYQAHQLGDAQALPYLEALGELWRIERRTAHFALSRAQQDAVRARYSVPLFETVVARAMQESPSVMPKTPLGKAVQYLLGQQAMVRRCLTTPGARLDNNLVENDIRPLKLGAKNWLKVGAPDAGPRLARLMTVIANCRLAGANPTPYLTDVMSRILAHPSSRLSELLPQAWVKTQTTQA